MPFDRPLVSNYMKNLGAPWETTRKEGRKEGSSPPLLLPLLNNFIKWILSLPYSTQSLSFTSYDSFLSRSPYFLLIQPFLFSFLKTKNKKRNKNQNKTNKKIIQIQTEESRGSPQTAGNNNFLFLEVELIELKIWCAGSSHLHSWIENSLFFMWKKWHMHAQVEDIFLFIKHLSGGNNR